MKFTIQIDIQDLQEELTTEQDLKSTLRFVLTSGLNNMDLNYEFEIKVTNVLPTR